MRTFRGMAAVILAVALVGGVAGCEKVDAVAKVNDDYITRAEFDRTYEQIAEQMGGNISEDDAISYKKQLLEMMIESVLVTQEAEKLGADLSDEAVNKSITDLLGGETDQAVIEEQVVAAGLTMDDLRKSVKDQIARDFISEKAAEEASGDTLPETYSLLEHILVADEAVATDLYNQIKAGGDFAALATANSTDPGSAADGGSLGWSPTSAYVPQFRDAADALEVDGVSEPVQSDYGWHIIRKSGEVEEGSPIADAPEELQVLLSSNSSEIALQEYIKKLRDNAKIEYLDEALKPAE